MIWVAYSGGVDSHVLLHIAKQSFANVRAIHVNHNLQGADDQLQQHCTLICEQLNIPLHICKVSATPQTGQSPEDAARIARRNAWQQVLAPGDLLLLAHHADDQAETILFRLLRGAGAKGLSGMRQSSKLDQITLLRPLLNFTKAELIAYAKQHNLQWLQDPSNQDETIDRNYIRQQIMPMLQQRWPAAVQNINRAGEICADLVRCVAPQVIAKLQGMLEDGALDLKSFNAQSKFWQQELLRAWLQQHALVPSAKQLSIIMQQVIAARIDAKPQLKLGNKIMRRSKNKLYILEAMPSSAVFEQSWDLQQDLQLPDGRHLEAKQVFKDAQQIAYLSHQEVVVRTGTWGRKAKKIFQQHSIPPWERSQYPLVFANKRLVTIVGLWTSSII